MKAFAKTPITITREAPGSYGAYCTSVKLENGDVLTIDVGGGHGRPKTALSEFWRAVRQHGIDYLVNDMPYRWHI